MEKILFNEPACHGNEYKYIAEAVANKALAGDGPFTKRCERWFSSQLGGATTLLTPSCTAALEMAAILIGIEPGDEVIMPSYTFVSTANAFVLRGATIVFVDIRPDTMNIDEKLVEAAITDKTRAIVPVHYAGVACEMDEIMDIANRHKLYVVEDAAQAVMAFYHGKPLGTQGHMATFSFHETKNYTSGGEGGLLVINDEKFAARAEVIREKGTNRSQFFRGQVDKYTWMDMGSSFLPSEIQAAYLYAQMEYAEKILLNRLDTWQKYHQLLLPLQNEEKIVLSNPGLHTQHNAHMFYFKADKLSERSELLGQLRHANINAVFHYIPLHSSPAGKQFGRFHGTDCFTTKESERLLRLPMYYEIPQSHIAYIANEIIRFYKGDQARG